MPTRFGSGHSNGACISIVKTEYAKEACAWKVCVMLAFHIVKGKCHVKKIHFWSHVSITHRVFLDCLSLKKYKFTIKSALSVVFELFPNFRCHKIRKHELESHIVFPQQQKIYIYLGAFWANQSMTSCGLRKNRKCLFFLTIDWVLILSQTQYTAGCQGVMSKMHIF